MARLVDDLLDVGRAVTGKIVLKRMPVNLADAVKASIGAIASGNPNNQGRVDLVSEPVWVSGDPVRLEQIVGNLVSNALKFTRGEGVISVFVGREGDDAVLRVADQGIGIPADMLPKIFDLFVQAHHTIDRTRGGLGHRPHAGAAPRRTARRHACTPPAKAMAAAPRSPCACRRSPRRRSTDECAGDELERHTTRPRFRIAPRAAGGRQPRFARDVSCGAARAWPRRVRSAGWRARAGAAPAARGRSPARRRVHRHRPARWHGRLRARAPHPQSSAWAAMCASSRSPATDFPKTASNPGRPASRVTSSSPWNPRRLQRELSAVTRHTTN